MTHPPRRLTIGGRAYAVTFDRRISRSQREVVAFAFDSQGQEAAREAMSTAAARSFLTRDTTTEPPTWSELEDLAFDLLKPRLEE